MKFATLTLFALTTVFVNGAFSQAQGRSGSCTICIEQYTNLLLEEYFSILDTLIGGFANCPDCVQLWQIDSAKSRAISLAGRLPCINTNQITGIINLSYIVKESQYRAVDSTFTQKDLDDAIAINNWLDFNPEAAPGKIQRPGCNGLKDCTAYFKVDVNILPYFYAVNFAYGVLPLNYLWSWGDGTYDSIPYPSHTYNVTGFYTICLTIEDSIGCDVTYCDSSSAFLFDCCDTNYITIISQESVGVNDNYNEEETFWVYPNPIRNHGVLEYILQQDEILSISLYDITGRMLKQLVAHEKRAKGTHKESLNFGEDLSPGIYVLRITNGHASMSIKVIK